MNGKDVYTTGEVAKICNVAPRTVSKWFDSGQLRGYRIPGSRDRRIPKPQLMQFMQTHSIPMDDLLSNQIFLLVVDSDLSLAQVIKESLEANGDYEVAISSTAFEAGIQVGNRAPSAVIVDATLPDIIPREFARTLRTHEKLRDVKLIATSGGHARGQGQALIHEGFDAFLAKPFEIRDLIALIQEPATVA